MEYPLINMDKKDISKGELKEQGFFFPSDDLPSIKFRDGHLYACGYGRFKYFVGNCPLDQYDGIYTIEALKELLADQPVRVTQTFEKHAVDFYNTHGD